MKLYKIISLKKCGKLDSFISVFEAEYQKQKKEDLLHQSQQLYQWGLDPLDTVFDLEKKRKII